MIGDNLKKLRKERGWTQKELEDHLISLALRQNRIQEMMAS